MQRHDIGADDVEKLIAELPDDRHHIVDNRTMPDICLQHLLSIALIDGKLTFESAHDFERMRDPQVLELRSRIDHLPNPDLTTALPPRQVILTIHTRDGRELRHRTHAVKGTPAAPMSRQEVVDKSTELIEPLLGPDRSSELIGAILGIERVERALDMRRLQQPCTGVLRPAGRSARRTLQRCLGRGRTKHEVTEQRIWKNKQMPPWRGRSPLSPARPAGLAGPRR
jgi:2-methylcitrate dehydratase PrpD